METAVPELTVQKVQTTEDRSLPIFAEFDRLRDRIRLEATLKNGLLIIVAPMDGTSGSNPTKIEIAQGS